LALADVPTLPIFRRKANRALVGQLRVGLRIGQFIPAKYAQELIENSDFRKFDDSLRMVLDCTPELAAESRAI
jgi:hypothetical protein